MLQRLEALGVCTLQGLEALGHAALFYLHLWRAWPGSHRDWAACLQQCHRLGVCALPVVGISALFIGMVVALQGYHTLVKFGAEMQLGPLLALSVLRELAPVVTGLVYAGRSGSALAAEIGLMQVTEQVAAMEMMGVSAHRRIVMPRYLAGCLMVPCLVLLFDVIALFGGYIVSVLWMGLDAGLFWSNMQAAVHFHHDVLNGVYKAFVFGLVINWAAVYQGFYAYPSASGMGRAATRTVVIASVMVLALDWILTSWMMGGWG